LATRDEQAIKQAKRRRRDLRVSFFFHDHKWARFSYQVLIPIGALALLIYGLIEDGTILHDDRYLYALVDVMILSSVFGDFLQGIFTAAMDRENRNATELGAHPIFGRIFLLVGFLFGILLAALAGTIFSDIFSGRNPSFDDVIYLTILAVMYTAVDFLWHFWRPRRGIVYRNLP
jgi:hypothetical protein